MTELAESIACPRCDFAATHNYCAQCGAELRPEPASARDAMRRVARSALGPLGEYIALIPAIARPRWLVEEVERDRLGVTELIVFSFAAAGVAAIVAFFFPGQQTFPDLPPIVSEVAEAAIAVGANLIGNLPLHWALGHNNPHKVPLRRFVALAIALLALLYPLIDLADGLLTKAGVESPDAITYPLSLVWYVIAYARLYRRPWWQAAAWIAVGLLVLVIGFVILASVWMAATGTKLAG
jgi:hypothetical protein